MNIYQEIVTNFPKQNIYIICSPIMVEKIQPVVEKLESDGISVGIACLWRNKEELFQGEYIYPTIRKYAEPLPLNSQVIVVGLDGRLSGILKELSIEQPGYYIKGFKEGLTNATPEFINQRRDNFLSPEP